MTIKLSNLKPASKSKHRSRRVGRGNNASDPGTYSGRGQKGQRSRSGGKKGLKLKGLRSNLRSMPKLKGFNKRKSLKIKPISLKDLENNFKENEIVDIAKLVKSGLIKKKDRLVKILAQGKITKKLTIKAFRFSEAAEKAIKKAGGKIEKI